MLMLGLEFWNHHWKYKIGTENCHVVGRLDISSMGYTVHLKYEEIVRLMAPRPDRPFPTRPSPH